MDAQIQNSRYHDSANSLTDVTHNSESALPSTSMQRMVSQTQTLIITEAQTPVEPQALTLTLRQRSSVTWCVLYLVLAHFASYICALPLFLAFGLTNPRRSNVKLSIWLLVSQRRVLTSSDWSLSIFLISYYLILSPSSIFGSLVFYNC